MTQVAVKYSMGNVPDCLVAHYTTLKNQQEFEHWAENTNANNFQYEVIEKYVVAAYQSLGSWRSSIYRNRIVGEGKNAFNEVENFVEGHFNNGTSATLHRLYSNATDKEIDEFYAD